MKVSITNTDSNRDYSKTQDVNIEINDDEIKEVERISQAIRKSIPDTIKSLTINIQLAVNQSVHGNLEQSSDRYD